MRFWIFLLLTHLSLLQADFRCEVDFLQSAEAIKGTVKKAFPEPFLLTDCIFKADNKFTIREFLYLGGFKIGSVVTPDQLAHTFFLIGQKEHFKSAIVSTIQIGNGIILECEFKAQKILGGVTFSGISFGHTRYIQYYDIQVGQPFSEEAHIASVQKIKQVFYDRGYKAFTCKEKIKYDEARKQVLVELVFSKGNSFSIGSVSVQVDTENSKLQKKVITRLKKSLELKRYTQELINSQTKDLQEFLQQQGFAKPTIKLQESIDKNRHEVDLFFTINLSKKRQFTFFGNHFFSNQQFNQMITRFGFSTEILPASFLAQDLQAEYYKKGFWQAQIDVEEQTDGTVYFIIKEGKRVRVKSVVLKGIEKSNQLLVKRFFRNFTSASYFDAQSLKVATERLISFYQERGFWDATVLKRTYELLEKDTIYRLILTIDEGKQQLVKKVIIEQFPELLKQPLFSKINDSKSPLPFDKRILREQRDWIINYFKKQGFLSVKAEFNLVEDDQINTIEWSIETGQKIRFGKTIVKGASHVSYKTIKNALFLREGKVWSRNAVQLGAMRLKQFDVFKQIRIHPLQSDDPSIRDVVVYLEDDQPFEIRLRGGFQQVSKNFALKKGSTYKAGGSFLWRNPTHHADLLRFDTDFTRFERRLDCSYSIPAPFKFPILASIKGYFNNYTQPLSIGSRRTLYKVTQEGILTNFTSQTRHASASLTTGLEWMETTKISETLAQAINFKANLISKKIPYLFIEPSVFVDLLDDKINPTKGLFVAGSLKGMFPLKSSSYFVKMLIEKGIFFPLIKGHDIVCAARARFGHIFNASFDKIMPPERFYLGGANSIRGYLPDACPPLGTIVDENGKMQRVPQGGKTMVNLNFELRIPVGQQFDWVMFQDFGVLVEGVEDLNRGNNNLAATGFGLRYKTSIGPIRFDIGWKWKKPFPEDSRYAWFLTFGHSF